MVTPTFFTWLANLISVSLCKTDVLVVLACASVGVLVGLAPSFSSLSHTSGQSHCDDHISAVTVFVE